jgi:Arc/MetJ family transcription regulator
MSARPPGLRTLTDVIFRAIADSRPYPDHGFASSRQWSRVAPRQIRLAELITTKSTLDLTSLLAEDSTFYGDLFAHVIYWQGAYYLEDGLHRAVRAALRGRGSLHARVLNLDELEAAQADGAGHD